jgi:hypothetical protein
LSDSRRNPTRASSWSADRAPKLLGASYRYVTVSPESASAGCSRVASAGESSANGSDARKNTDRSSRWMYWGFDPHDRTLRVCQASCLHKGVVRSRHTYSDIEDRICGRLVCLQYNESTREEDVVSCLPYCGA